MNPLQIHQIRHNQKFQQYAAGIRSLVGRYQDTLLDVSCGESPEVLVQNLSESLPHVWIISARSADVLGLASLTDEIPGRHAYLHGLSHPCLRHHPVVAKTALKAIWYAFSQLKVLKVKAEFEADNRGAKGFCWRMGFQKVAHLIADNQVGGELKDVTLYALSWDDFLKNASRYRQLTGRSQHASF